MLQYLNMPSPHEPSVVTAVLIGRIGDLLVAGPFLRALRLRYPSARLRLVAAAQCASAAEILPWLDERLYLHKVSRLHQNILLAYNLLKGTHDIVIDLNPAPSRVSAGIVGAVRAAEKWGFEKERFSSVFTATVAAAKPDEPMIERYARLAAALAAPFEARLEVALTPEHESAAETLLKDLPAGKRILIHAGNFKKFDNRWPEEKFAALGQALAKKGACVLWLAGPGEQAPVEKIAAQARTGTVVSPPSLGAAGALMKRVFLVICNITGTTHLAAAVGAPTFGLYAGYTNAVWRPRGALHQGIVSSDWRSCRDISVESVLRGTFPGSQS